MSGRDRVFCGEQLRGIVERVERLQEEKDNIASDIQDIFLEAKKQGYDLKALREVIRLRRQDAQKRAEHEALVDSYKHALGMLADTPLGEWAMKEGRPAVERAFAVGLRELGK